MPAIDQSSLAEEVYANTSRIVHGKPVLRLVKRDGYIPIAIQSPPVILEARREIDRIVAICEDKAQVTYGAFNQPMIMILAGLSVSQFGFDSTS